MAIENKHVFGGIDVKSNLLSRKDGSARDAENVLLDENRNLIKRKEWIKKEVPRSSTNCYEALHDDAEILGVMEYEDELLLLTVTPLGVGGSESLYNSLYRITSLEPTIEVEIVPLDAAILMSPLYSRHNDDARPYAYVMHNTAIVDKVTSSVIHNCLTFCGVREDGKGSYLYKYDGTCWVAAGVANDHMESMDLTLQTFSDNLRYVKLVGTYIDSKNNQILKEIGEYKIGAEDQSDPNFLRYIFPLGNSELTRFRTPGDEQFRGMYPGVSIHFDLEREDWVKDYPQPSDFPKSLYTIDMSQHTYYETQGVKPLKGLWYNIPIRYLLHRTVSKLDPYSYEGMDTLLIPQVQAFVEDVILVSDEGSGEEVYEIVISKLRALHRGVWVDPIADNEGKDDVLIARVDLAPAPFSSSTPIRVISTALTSLYTSQSETADFKSVCSSIYPLITGAPADMRSISGDTYVPPWNTELSGVDPGIYPDENIEGVIFCSKFIAYNLDKKVEDFYLDGTSAILPSEISGGANYTIKAVKDLRGLKAASYRLEDMYDEEVGKYNFEKVSHCIAHQGQIVAVEDNFLVFSDLSLGGSPWMSEVDNYFSVGEDSEGSITSVTSTKEGLIVFRGRGHYLITGNIFSGNFNSRDIGNSHIGSLTSYVPSSLAGDYFLSKLGPYITDRSGTLANIGLPISPYFKDGKYKDHILDLRRSKSFYNRESLYIFSVIPFKGEEGCITIAYSTEFGEFFIWTGIDAMGGITPIYNEDSPYFGNFIYSDKSDLYLPSDEYVEGVDAHYESNALTAGQPSLLKSWRKLLLYTIGTKPTELVFKSSEDWGKKDGQPSTDDTVQIVDTIPLDMKSFSPADSYARSIKIESKGTNTLLLNGYEVSFELETDEEVDNHADN